MLLQIPWLMLTIGLILLYSGGRLWVLARERARDRTIAVLREARQSKAEARHWKPVPATITTRCDYCARPVSLSLSCEGCGAPRTVPVEPVRIEVDLDRLVPPGLGERERREYSHAIVQEVRAAYAQLQPGDAFVHSTAIKISNGYSR